MKINKKPLEVALPLDAINKASAREKSIRHGHPSTLHLWWARRPLAAARAVIFAQMVDDPSAHPDLFPTEKKQEKERQRLFKIIEDLVLWENTNNEEMLQRARDEIWQSWRYICAENADHPRAKELFDRYKLPAFHDPFAGGGSLPSEAQRLGLEAYASDLNPVAVLINKAMVEIPPKFAGRPPVNPEWQNLSKEEKALRVWKGTQGLAEDVRYYGQWMRDEAENRIGHLYPKVEITAEMAKERSDLKPLLGKKLTVNALLWARTVKSPNPAFANVDMPLASTFMLSTKPGKEVYIEPVIENGGYRFRVKVGKPMDMEAAKNGTKLGRGANFRCLMSGTPITGDYIKTEGQAGRMGTRMMAIVAEVERGRVYLSPSNSLKTIGQQSKPKWKPVNELVGKCRDQLPLYGMNTFSEIFTPRQLIAMEVFSGLVHETRERVMNDGFVAGLNEDSIGLEAGGKGSMAYSDAIGTYLACGVSRAADYWNSLATWEPGGGFVAHAFTRQAIPMVWDFAESNPFSDASGNWDSTCMDWVKRVVEGFRPQKDGYSIQADAQAQSMSLDKMISTDPPYYDNIAYADLSDFFSIWLRRSLREVFADFFATLAAPKTEELIATLHRHESKKQAEAFFLDGMTRAMHRLVEQSHPAMPLTIYYAFKQSETDNEEGISSTGWETFLEAAIQAGLALTGTWPIRTERGARSIGIGTNALASSIVLVCRPRVIDSPIATRREFLSSLKFELPLALIHLQRSNIAPVDLAQAAIGPGMSVFTRYSKVLDAEGKSMDVREALILIMRWSPKIGQCDKL